MLSTLALIALLATPSNSPSPAAEKPAGEPIRSLAAPGFQCANIDLKVVDSFMVHFTQQLATHGFQTQTPAEVGALLGLERQRQVMSCSDEGCSAEIAAALGVDAIITGSIGKIGKGYLINIKIMYARTGKAAAVFSGRPKSDDEALDFLEASAKRFAEQYPPPATARVVTLQSDAPTTATTSPTTAQGTSTSSTVVATGQAPAPASSSNLAPWIAGGAGVAALAVGGIFFGMSRTTAGQVASGGSATSRAELEALAAQGKVQETVGFAGLGVGVALGVTAAVLGIVDAPAKQAAVGLAPIPGGGVVTMGGSL